MKAKVGAIIGAGGAVAFILSVGALYGFFSAPPAEKPKITSDSLSPADTNTNTHAQVEQRSEQELQSPKESAYISAQECWQKYNTQQMKVMQKRGMMYSSDVRNYVDANCNLVVYMDYYNFDGSVKEGAAPPERSELRTQQIQQEAAKDLIELAKRTG